MHRGEELVTFYNATTRRREAMVSAGHHKGPSPPVDKHGGRTEAYGTPTRQNKEDVPTTSVTRQKSHTQTASCEMASQPVSGGEISGDDNSTGGSRPSLPAIQGGTLGERMDKGEQGAAHIGVLCHEKATGLRAMIYYIVSNDREHRDGRTQARRCSTPHQKRQTEVVES